jgi:hypothetical protein
MGRKNYGGRKPQTPKERVEAARRILANLTPRDECHVGDDKLPRAGSPVYGSGKRKGVTGGRGAVRPPGAARVAPLVDVARQKPSLPREDAFMQGVTHPGTSTVVRSRKGGVSAVYVKPPKPRDECPGCGSHGTHADECEYRVAPEDAEAREALRASEAREAFARPAKPERASILDGAGPLAEIVPLDPPEDWRARYNQG